MPFINVKLAGPEPSVEQKSEIIKKMTQVLVDVLGKKPDNLVVIIEAVSADNYGVGGESVSQRNAKAKA